MEEEKKLPEEEKKDEAKPNPLLDIVENNIDIEPDSAGIKISIPFDIK
jgi:hypothetical protein